MNVIVANKVALYPHSAQKKFQLLRRLIYEVAKDNNLDPVEETLKWGEPAYLTKFGSTIRIDWRSKDPHKIFIFFNCKTTLIETFKEDFFDVFCYRGNRAIVLEINQNTPAELKSCLLMALNYHRVKKLPLLGA